MSTFIKNRNGELIEMPPYQCKMCGKYEIEFPHDICRVCGWQDDAVQNRDHNYEGGANKLSFNQYNSVLIKNKDEIFNEPSAGLKGHLVTKIFRSQK